VEVVVEPQRQELKVHLQQLQVEVAQEQQQILQEVQLVMLEVEEVELLVLQAQEHHKLVLVDQVLLADHLVVQVHRVAQQQLIKAVAVEAQEELLQVQVVNLVEPVDQV
jgi:hypothetical protein